MHALKPCVQRSNESHFCHLAQTSNMYFPHVEAQKMLYNYHCCNLHVSRVRLSNSDPVRCISAFLKKRDFLTVFDAFKPQQNQTMFFKNIIFKYMYSYIHIYECSVSFNKTLLIATADKEKMLQLAEGSLEVKLPTIWTDGKATTGRSSDKEKVRREKIKDGEDQRGRKVRREKMQVCIKVGKS